MADGVGTSTCELMNLSEVRTRPGYDVLALSARFKSWYRSRCTLLVHTLHMEIRHCKRCGGDWCYHGVGRPLRCGKCKSPYWDRPRKETTPHNWKRETRNARKPGVNV